MAEELMLKVENVKKKYRLGVIGGGTLSGDLQSWWARVRHKEDPNSKIGEKVYAKNEIFMALNGVSLDVKKGERVGIIGHNGAGKSTLLKLLSQVTAPSEGKIYLNGRIASMLEVGTGFHPELTGRENIYLNGAILGMTKVEIDKKIDDIIDFSECRKFIDTPVKRYSSGMYVKLAFSVAAHLDSEIMIMDEVLAVGDMAFQKKCLDKMNEVSKTQGRTILYVSHNMNTIRQLCDRVVVLDHGSVIFNGDVEKGINCYFGINNLSSPCVELSKIEREKYFMNGGATMERLEVDTKDSIFELDSVFRGVLYTSSDEKYDDANLKLCLINNGVCVVSYETGSIVSLDKNKTVEIPFSISLKGLAPANYTLKMVLSRRNGVGGTQYLDVLLEGYRFEVVEPNNFHENQKWNIQYNGYFIGENINISDWRKST